MYTCWHFLETNFIHYATQPPLIWGGGQNQNLHFILNAINLKWTKHFSTYNHLTGGHFKKRTVQGVACKDAQLIDNLKSTEIKRRGKRKWIHMQTHIPLLNPQLSSLIFASAFTYARITILTCKTITESTCLFPAADNAIKYGISVSACSTVC